jgi:hypothetical protein
MMNSAYASSKPAHLRQEDHLDHNKGSGGLTNWIAQMANVLIGTGPARLAFLTGVPNEPTEPTQDDNRPSRKPSGAAAPTTLAPSIPPIQPAQQPSGIPHPRQAGTYQSRAVTRSTSPAAASPTPAAAVATVPQRKYELDPATDELTNTAFDKFTDDVRAYTIIKSAYESSASTVFATVIANCDQSTLTALDNAPAYASIRAACDCARLHHLLLELFKQTTIVRSQAALRNMISVKQGTDTVTVYTMKARHVMEDVKANYEDKDHLGFISIDTLATSVFLAGLGPANQPILDQLMLSNTSIHDISLPKLQADARDYEANSNSNKPHTKQPGGGPDSRQGGAGGKPNQGDLGKKGGSGTGKPTKEALNYIQALAAVQLGTAQPTQGPMHLSKSGLPPRDLSLWNDHAHPHCRPKGLAGPAPTDKPYCAHCYKNGYIITDQRHLDDCSDHRRFLGLPKTLFNGSVIDFATLEALVAHAGLTNQNQY